MRTRSLAALAAGALLVATLAGCGGSDDKKKADEPTSTSTATATTSPTDEPAASGTSTGSPEANAFADKLIKAMREKKTAHMVIDMGSSVSLNADVRYAADATDMKMRMTQGNVTLSVILVDDAMYLQQGAGGKYKKIDKSDPTFGALLSQVGNLGPEASVKAMKGAIKSVQKQGSATLDGDKVTKYRLTIDTTAMASMLGSTSTEDLPKTLTYTMYLDDDDLLRGADMSVAGQALKLRVSKWGEPVEIKAPPASQLMK
ncbi:MAG: LppX_LprAFG lipoprotein [Nocardioidaceae bacterium]|nr:LppX_LprAFG lipoprotein [Nocardioidaceae bacterium]